MGRTTLSYNEVKAKLGKARVAFEKLIGQIRYHYELDELWQAGNSNHKHHSNLLFKRGSKTLITLCLREGYYIACVVLGKDEREKFDQEQAIFSEAVQAEYNAVKVYHDGKWLGFDIKDDTLIDDILRLMQVKSKPNRKVLPTSIEKCVSLDIGLSHDEITKMIMS